MLNKRNHLSLASGIPHPCQWLMASKSDYGRDAFGRRRLAVAERTLIIFDEVGIRNLCGMIRKICGIHTIVTTVS